MSQQTPCDRVRGLVSSAPERADELPKALREHTAGCAACQVELEAARRLGAMLVGAHGELEARFDAADVLARARRGASRPTRPSSRRASWWAPVVLAGAAAAVVVLLPGSEGVDIQPGPSEPGASVAPEAETAPGTAEAETGLASEWMSECSGASYWR